MFASVRLRSWFHRFLYPLLIVCLCSSRRVTSRRLIRPHLPHFGSGGRRTARPRARENARGRAGDSPWVHLVWHRYYAEGCLPKLVSNFRGSFLWKDILKLLDSFKGMAMVSVQDGKSCYFWLDLSDNIQPVRLD